MMAGGVQMENLAIESVGNPGQRVPVHRIRTAECPGDRVPTQSRLNVKIVGDVLIIVKIEELKMRNRIIESQRQHCQQQAKDEGALLRRGKQVSIFR